MLWIHWKEVDVWHVSVTERFKMRSDLGVGFPVCAFSTSPCLGMPLLSNNHVVMIQSLGAALLRFPPPPPPSSRHWRPLEAPCGQVAR
eukprot:753948-Hanusia_phi.AAC.2